MERDENIERLKVVNRQISNLMSKRTSLNGALPYQEVEDLKALNVDKHRLSIPILERRHLGENGIEVVVFGREQDRLHYFSKNPVEIDIDVGENSPYRSRFSLANFRVMLGVDITGLIGQPDKFIEERPGEYITRTIAEVNEVGDAVFRKGQLVLGFREDDLSRLFQELVKRVFRFRADGMVSEGEMVVSYLSDPYKNNSRALIECYYGFGNHKVGFRIPVIDYNSDMQLQTLVREGGGFDKRTRRKKHY